MGSGRAPAPRPPYNKEPFYIRRLLTQGSVKALDRRAMFVGAEAYEAAGGVSRGKAAADRALERYDSAYRLKPFERKTFKRGSIAKGLRR